VDPNPSGSPARSGTIVVGDSSVSVSFTVSQDAAP
jgi:hypothetical protein